MKSENRLSSWKCSQCEKEFKYESEKRRHEQSHVPQFECKVCSKKFSFLSALRRHERQHERKGSASCKECNRKFRDEILLKRHIQYAHKGIHTCTKCKSTYRSEIALRTHMKTHKPESERKFICNFKGCNKKFNFAHHLKHHELTHTDVKPHVCKFCGKCFIQLNHLKVHQRVHQPDSWLYCSQIDCNKRFTNKYALRRHIATHKHKLSDPLDVEPPCKKEESEGFMSILCYEPAHIQDAIFSITCVEKGRILAVEPLIPHADVLNAANTNIDEDHKEPDTSEVNNVDLNNVDLKKRLKHVKYETDNVLDLDVGNNNDELREATETDVEVRFISDCQSVLGKCIVTGEAEANDNCLCNQMNAHTDNKVSTLSLSRNNNSLVKMSDDLTCIEKRRKYANACETCECASTCDLKDKAFKNDLPKIVYGNDGIVKIADTFDVDLDLPLQDNKPHHNKFDIKSLGISNCKDVLGNCIVSGNGTMGEECLCARMTAEDQQVIEQEMDEITPHPWSR